MRKLIIILAIAIFSTGATLPPSVMNIFYIDASMPTTDDGMNESSLYTLKQKLETAADAGELLVFLSNGKEPLVYKKKKDIEKLLDNIYSKRFEPPNDLFDKSAMRDLVYPELKKFNGAINFHFFLSDMTTKSVKDGADTVVKFFPKEVGQILGNGSSVSVNIYYSNNSGKVNKAELEKSLQFYNDGSFGPSIAYSTFDL